MHSILCQTLRFLMGNQDTSRAPNNNKQPCSCQKTSLRNLLFHLVQRICLHFKSPDLYLFCTTKTFPKFPLPFESQASFQSEEFGSDDYAPPSLSLVACSLSSCGRACSCKKDPCSQNKGDRFFVYFTQRKCHATLLPGKDKAETAAWGTTEAAFLVMEAGRKKCKASFGSHC